MQASVITTFLILAALLDGAPDAPGTFTDDGGPDVLSLVEADGVEAQLKTAFFDQRSPAVRSSSNAEDLSGAAGAGLFEWLVQSRPPS